MIALSIFSVLRDKAVEDRSRFVHILMLLSSLHECFVKSKVTKKYHRIDRFESGQEFQNRLVVVEVIPAMRSRGTVIYSNLNVKNR